MLFLSLWFVLLASKNHLEVAARSFAKIEYNIGDQCFLSKSMGEEPIPNHLEPSFHVHVDGPYDSSSPLNHISMFG